ncbi:MAG: endonuclease 4 [Gemmatimonadetes bacterium]|nr:endonuclease 4 [Gemmatimonadota bacterium]
MELLGAHVSSAGGTHNAPVRAKEIGATALQLFTKMANRWAERACEDEECAAFRTAMADTQVRATVSHDSYLINLASPDATLRARSIESFVSELRRCEALGIDFLVSHPGNFMDERTAGVQRNADAISEALQQVPGRTVLCMESTAGSGTAIGANFEELAELISLVDAGLRDRMGICVDSCHAYSAGYDLVNDFDGVIEQFDRTIGLGRLKVLHLNDSKTPFASRRDRHELIGEGSLGEQPFRRFMTDPRLAGVVKIIETPKGDDATAMDTLMLGRLRAYAAGLPVVLPEKKPAVLPAAKAKASSKPVATKKPSEKKKPAGRKPVKKKPAKKSPSPKRSR